MDQKITAFTGVTSVDRNTAELFLKGNNEDIDAAVNEYFENSDPSRYRTAVRWNESPWTEDRHGGGGAQYQAGGDRAFNLHDENDNARLAPLGAPSRPPTRNSHRGNYDNTSQWVSQNQAGMGAGDEEMQEMIHRSLQDQETGVVETIESEHVPDPEPAQRTRLDGAPAFMKPLPRPDYLGGLITILHCIPQCREALLARHKTIPDYGHSAQWWEGEDIGATTVKHADVTTDSDVEAVDDSPNEEDRVIHEMQRLMAFLDLTDRSYGSVESLSRLPAVKRWLGTSDQYTSLCNCFLAAWDDAVENDSPHRSLFRSTVTFPGHDKWETQDIRGFSIIPHLARPDAGNTIYRALDAVMWDDIPSRDWPANSWLKTLAPVVHINLLAQLKSSSSERFHIPVVLYADRYMQENAQIVNKMRTRISQCNGMIKELDADLEKLANFEAGGRKDRKASQLFDVTLGYIRERNSKEKEAQLIEEDDTPTERILKHLESVQQRVEARTSSLYNKKTHAEKEITKLSTLFTEPAETTEFDPKSKYHLRGVVLFNGAKEDTYVLQDPLEEGVTLIDVEKDELSSQWWHLSYEVFGTASTRTERVTEEAVLEAARNATATTLLIYASEEMLSSDNTKPLTQPLEDFVKADNNTFRGQLETLQSIGIAEDRMDDSAFASRATSIQDEPMASVEVVSDDRATGDAAIPDRPDTSQDGSNIKNMEMAEVHGPSTGDFLFRGMRGDEAMEEDHDEKMGG
ncbi:MAG: hypothetical protein M1828_004896 [Chrysothrix sp. TS-e1954]|nr:MAG: hypothetical protein M1828_004896 [Chrysothrix sp. TS-e1954]